VQAAGVKSGTGQRVRATTGPTNRYVLTATEVTEYSTNVTNDIGHPTTLVSCGVSVTSARHTNEEESVLLHHVGKAFR
jgi:hypothetical protein